MFIAASLPWTRRSFGPICARDVRSSRTCRSFKIDHYYPERWITWLVGRWRTQL